MSLLLDSTIKVSLIVLMALAAQLLLRRQSAAVRHWVMAVAIACAVVTPVVGVIAPSWYIGLATSSRSSVAPPPSVSTTTVVLNPSLPAGQPGPAESAAGPSSMMGLVGLVGPVGLSGRTMSALVGPIWLTGVAISLSILLVGMARLASLASRARRIERGRLANLARETSAEFGLRRPVVILQSSHPALLATWGLLRPKVILPADAAHWSDDRARVVLRHELAHIRRGDWVVLVAAEVLRAVHWFNPLVWIACRRVRQESECACDDAVLNAGVEGSEYATHLLDLARTLTTRRRTLLSGLPASAMARPSCLEGRIRVMLNTSVNRSPLTRPFRVATVIALLSLTVLIAGLGAQAFFTLSGSVFDATNRTLPDAKLVLTNAGSQAKHEVRSNRTGRFEFVGLPPGDYALEVSIPGFSTFKDKLTMVRNIDRTIELQVGSLEETITVTGSRSTQDAPPEPAAVIAEELKLLDLSMRAKARQQATLEKCAGTPAGPMGGQILAPMRLNSANPKYPDNLRAAGIGGVVKMEALIGTDGNIQDVRAVESPHPDLESAAIEAVRRWQYTPTLLNCVPIEVRMIVTTNFNSLQ